MNLLYKVFTVKDFLRDPLILATYADPSGLAQSHDSEGIQLLGSNPWANEDDPALILAIEGNTIVGRLGAYAGYVQYDGRVERVMCLSGFVLDQNYASSGAGGIILMYALKWGMPLSVCGGPSPQLQKVYERAGFANLGPLRRFVYFNTSKVIIARYMKVYIARAAAKILLDPLLKLYYALHLPISSKILTFKSVESFSHETDMLLGSERRNWFPKNAAVLNWAVKHRGLHAFEIWRGGGLVGYCLLRKNIWTADKMHRLPEMTVGTLLDYYLADDSLEAKSCLVSFAGTFFEKLGVDVFEFQVRDNEMARRCKRLGMVHLGGHKIFFKPARGAKLKDETPWFLTLATGDMLVA